MDSEEEWEDEEDCEEGEDWEEDEDSESEEDKEASREIEAAVKAENIEKVVELIKVYHDVTVSHKPLFTALEVGNVEILKLLLESEFVEIDKYQYVHLSGDPMVFVAQQNYDEEKKTEILKLLVPSVFSWYQRQNFPSPSGYLGCLLHLYYTNNIFLLKFFIHKYYTEKNNTLYSLIKKLEAVIDNPYILCIFLHDKMNGYRLFDTQIFGYDCEPIMDIFINLLVNNTPLAAEVAKALIEKEFTPECYSLSELTKPNQQKLLLKLTPLPRKCIFQFFYHMWNPFRRIELDMFCLIEDWLDLCSSNYEMFEQLWRCVLPLFLNPEHIDSATAYFDGFEELIRIMTKDENCISLKGICRNVASSKIAAAVNFNLRNFFQRVWSLNIPETLKCYLLRIPDASWMNDLPIH